MSDRPVTWCHIKRHPKPPRLNADEPMLCGAEDPGLVYVKLGRDEQIPETDFPVCVPCAERHIDEHYGSRPAA